MIKVLGFGVSFDIVSWSSQSSAVYVIQNEVSHHWSWVWRPALWKFEVLIWKSFQVCFRVFQSQQVLTAMIDAPVVKSCCCINHSGAVVHTAAQGLLEDLKLVHQPLKEHSVLILHCERQQLNTSLALSFLFTPQKGVMRCSVALYALSAMMYFLGGNFSNMSGKGECLWAIESLVEPGWPAEK